MKNKIKLYGIGNTEKFNYYIFDKKQEIAEKLAKISEKVFNLKWSFTYTQEDEKTIRTIKINIEKYKDKHVTVSNKNARIDVFYGNKKMFITVYCSLKLRAKLNNELKKITVMPEVKTKGSFFKEKKRRKNGKKKRKKEKR